MTEEEKNTVTLKVTEADREWAAAEQARLRKAEGRKVSQAVLFRRMVEVYARAPESTPPPQRPEVLTLEELTPPEYLDDLKAWAEVLASGHKDLIGLVLTPLGYAQRQARLRAGKSHGGE